MKKLVIAALLSTFAATSFANQDDKGFYVQGDLGFSKIEIEYLDSGFDVIDDSSFTQRLSGGYDFGRFRVALDYTNYGSYSRNVSDGYRSASLKAKITSLGLTGFYDFKSVGNFGPYVGVRLSSNQFKLSGYAYGGGYSNSGAASERVGGIGILAGTQYKLTQNVSLNLGAEFNRLSEETRQFGINAGIRYSF